MCHSFSNGFLFGVIEGITLLKLCKTVNSESDFPVLSDHVFVSNINPFLTTLTTASPFSAHVIERLPSGGHA